MQTARHRAPSRTRTSSLSRLALASTVVTATLVTAGVTAGASAGDPAASTTAVRDSGSTAGHAGAAIGALDLDALAASRAQRVSRAGQRTAARVTLEPEATGHRYATAPLNVWTAPGEKGPRVGLVKEASKLAVTGKVVGGWAEILLREERRGRPVEVVRWVNAEHLARTKPKPEPTGAAAGAAVGGLSSAPCPDGSSIESGLTSNADVVYRAVCAAFPQPTTYGGLDPHGEHYDGRAIDIMISGSVGWQIAEWLRANAGTLNVRTIIYAQKIWTPERSAEGWRWMSDRGSTTANHYDHVHVSVY